MPQQVPDGRLALRIRPASAFDVACLRALRENKDSTARANVALQRALLVAAAEQMDVRPRDLRPAQLVTELDENVMTARTSAKALASVAPMAQEAARYLFSNDAGPRTMVKPGPDPARPQETTWFTEEGLHEECYRPSTNWTQAGQRAKGRSLGKVYLEVLECRGLPNVDAGTHHVCTRAICRCSEATHLFRFFLIQEGPLATRRTPLSLLSMGISWFRLR